MKVLDSRALSFETSGLVVDGSRRSVVKAARRFAPFKHAYDGHPSSVQGDSQRSCTKVLVTVVLVVRDRWSRRQLVRWSVRRQSDGE
jgi:hypothetical protein